MRATSGLLSREELPEATVLVVHARELLESQPATAALQGALYELAGSGVGRVVLDLTEVEYLGSYCLSVLPTARTRLMRAAPPPPRPQVEDAPPACGCGAVFSSYRDRAEALAAIRGGEPDPLVLCGARPKVGELFSFV